MNIRTCRVYAWEPDDGDGQVFLVDRLWPRGFSKEELAGVTWIPEVAPSDELRRWFGHDPERWPAFRERYQAELRERPAAWKPLAVAAQKVNITLLFAAKDEEHNNAVALKEFLRDQLGR